MGDYQTDFVHFVSVESRLARSIDSTFHWPVDSTRLHRQTIDSISRLDRFWGLPLVKAETAFKKIKYGENDFQYGRWNYYTLQCGTIMTLISPGDCTLQCGMWLWNHDSEFIKWQHPALWYMALGWHAIEFARWQHPAMWHVTLGSWHWVRQVAAPCSVSGGLGWHAIEFAQTSPILEFYIWFRFWLKPTTDPPSAPLKPRL